MNKFTAYLLFFLAGVLYILCCATAISAVYPLFLPDTVSAIEMSFGKFVIIIAMLVLAHHCIKNGKKRLKTS